MDCVLAAAVLAEARDVALDCKPCPSAIGCRELGMEAALVHRPASAPSHRGTYLCRQSVPEAGRTGADAARAPTTPPPVTTQTHAKSMASTGGDRWSAGEHPATGRMERLGQAEAGELPNRARCRSGDDLPGGHRGHGPLPASLGDARSEATGSMPA